MNLYDVRIRQNLDTRFGGKVRTDHEVAIAMHEIDGNFFPRQLAKSLLGPCVMFIRVVVTNPTFKKIAENIKGIRIDRFGFQKAQELIGDVGPVGLKMEVGYK